VHRQSRQPQPEDSRQIGPLRKGQIRDTLINRALDETLARAIFHCIAGSKGSAAFPLELLELRAWGGESYGSESYGLQEVLTCISHEWLLVRNSRDDCREHVTATDLTTCCWANSQDGLFAIVVIF